MDVLDELAQNTKMPGFDLVGKYEAAAPVYRARAKASVLRTKKLPTIAEFALRLINCGVTGQMEIASLLGLESKFAKTSLSLLNQQNLVTIEARNIGSGSLKLSITDRGKAALSQAVAAVETEMIDILVDGLSGKCTYPDGPVLKDLQSMRKSGVKQFLPVVRGARPTLDILNGNIADIQRVLDAQIEDLSQVMPSDRLTNKRRASDLNRLLEVVETVSSRLLYKLVRVLVFRDRENGQAQLRVFEGYHPMEEYDQVLTKQLRRGRINVLPAHLLTHADEADATGTDVELVSKVETLIELCDKKAYAESRIDDAEYAIAAAGKAAAPDPTELTAKSQRIQSLEQQLSELRNDKDNVERQLESTRLVLDYEHRELLKRALTDARVSVVIFSPWINRHAVDGEIIKLIRKCLQRKVHVAIAYGMKPKPGQPDQRFIDSDVESDFAQIKRGPQQNLFCVENIGKTHEKILICDDQFCVVTSNNFLSFNGNYKVKRETGVYSESKELIRKLRERAERSFSSVPNMSALPQA